MTPNDGLSVGVHVEILLQLLPWEGVQLLDTSDGSVFEAVIGAMLVERSVHLTRTEDNTIDLLGFVDAGTVFGIGDDPLELRVASEFFNW